MHIHLSNATMSRPGPRRGSALVAVLAVMVLLTSLAVAHFSAGAGSAVQLNRQLDRENLIAGGESALDASVATIWGSYLAANGGEAGNAASFRSFLDGLGISPDPGAGRPAPDSGVDLAPSALLGESKTGHGTIGGMVIDELRVVRRDDGEATHLYLTATGRPVRGERLDLAGARRSVQKAFIVDSEPWNGLDFALLANNINCIFCHATVDSAPRRFNTDASLHGTFDRVKVGSLDSLRLRSNSHTTIYGTLYTGGAATDKQGHPIESWHSMDVKSVEFDHEGKIVEDILGNAQRTDFVPAGPNAGALENLYVDYGTGASGQVDGYLPESFPALFPDDGGIDPITGEPISTGAGNRRIDPGEFAAVSADSGGSITGGIIHVNDGSAPISSGSELSTALAAGNSVTLPPVVHGDVILIGTEDRPIQIDGQVSIDGDLVIQGVVRGEGALLATGNVYLPGDLTYADGTANGNRTFGVAQDGSTNALALAAGGNIVAGDLYNGSDPGSTTGDESGEFGFVLSEISIFNRREWAKTQPMLPGKGDPAAPEDWSVVNPDYEGPDYVARYFSFTEGGTIPIYNRDGLYFDPSSKSWVGKEHVKSWSTSAHTLAHPGDPNDPILYRPDGSPRAAVQALTTRGDWISREMLAELMRDRMARHEEGKALEVDAFLYSANSIYGIVKRKTAMAGSMTVNGGVVAPDLGMLAASGFQVNYDRRPTSMLNLGTAAGGRVRLRTALWYGEVPRP